MFRYALFTKVLVSPEPSYSPVENQYDLELGFKIVFFVILVVQALYLMKTTDATLASLSVLKY